MDVHEVVRLLQAGASDREVAQLVGRIRRTVARYRRGAGREGLLAGPLPAVGELETRLAASLHDPLVQRSYRECAEHYGFRIAALPPRTPHLKGKVEQGGVHYVA